MDEKTYNDYMEPNRRKQNPRFKDYTGNRSWKVKHPDLGEVTVIAPSNPAAIVTAASVWNKRWQSIDFYANCEVKYLGTVINKK